MVWSNLNGKYAYATSVQFYFPQPLEKGTLQAEVFLHTTGFTEDDLAKVGLDENFDYFRTHDHTFTIE